MSDINTVLITGAYGTENLGDKKILSGLATLCRSHYDADNVVAASINPESSRKIGSLDEVIPTIERGPREWISKAKTADLIILGGGTVISTPIARRHGVITVIAQLLGIKIYVAAGVGYGDWIDKAVSKQFLQLVDGVTVRDPESKRQLESMGIDPPVDIVPDPGFVDEPETGDVSYEFPEKYVLVCVRPVNHGNSTSSVDVQGLTRGLDIINETHPHSMFFYPFHRGKDVNFSQQVISEMETEATLINTDHTIAESESVIANADAIISMRLHSMILAAHKRTPFVPISYAPKCRLFLDMIGVDEFLTHDSISEQVLSEMVEDSITSGVPIVNCKTQLKQMEDDCHTLLSCCDNQDRVKSIAAIGILSIFLPIAFLEHKIPY